MTTITLAPDLVDQIAYLTGQDPARAQLLVEEAVRVYLTQLRRKKIRAETEAFEAQHDALLTEYSGQYVALHQGQVIDHDPDLRALHLRVYEQVGHTPVLLKLVTMEPERELVFRSPRLERSGV